MHQSIPPNSGRPVPHRTAYCYSLLLLITAFTFHLPGQEASFETHTQRAYQLAWSQQFSDALRVFEAVLSESPDHLEARMGRAWTLAWSARYSEARSAFHAILSDHPGQADARKGLAFVALWSGNAAEAAGRFGELSNAAPDNPEYRFHYGQARAAAGHHGEARAAYRRTLALAPGHRDAQRAMRTLNEQPAFLEARLEVGYSDLSSETAVGARQVELALSPVPGQRYWLRYDDALSLDNPVLRTTDTRLPAYFAGAVTQLGGGGLVKAEAGWRDLPSGGDLLFIGEGVWFARPGTHLKLGGIVAGGPDRSADQGIFLGFGQRIGGSVDLSPTAYFTRSGPSGDSEWRGVLGASYHIPGRFHLEVSGGFGRLESDRDGIDGDIATGHVRASIPVFTHHWTWLMARRDALPSGGFTVIALGLNLRLERS